ncbi:MAG: 30S ribosome-binding factor RbfA [Alphaproteobacteria bacterium]|nr:30S ribosome-binding factor RbfA [Alphaproteobacteria bacterium]
MTRGKAKAPSQRQLRVGEEVRHALAMIMERTEFRDPALLGAPVTVTEVRVSPDLRHAAVFVAPLGGGDPIPVIQGLKRVRPFLRHQLAGEVRLQFIPDLSFEPDVSFDRAQHIEQILHSPEVARDLDEPRDDEA